MLRAALARHHYNEWWASWTLTFAKPALRLHTASANDVKLKSWTIIGGTIMGRRGHAEFVAAFALQII